MIDDDSTDLALVERWRSGDNGAGSVLVRRHFDALDRFFATKVNGPGEDLIQQTFMACVEAKNAFRGECSFRAYLLVLARFQLYTHYRKTHRARAFDFTTTSVRDLGTSPSGTVARRQEHQLLQHAMQRVPVDQQIALELAYWEGLPASEIARVLDIPENTVYSRLRRAKDHLRKALAQISTVAQERDGALELLERTGDE